jgi:hypothetical protein
MNAAFRLPASEKALMITLVNQVDLLSIPLLLKPSTPALKPNVLPVRPIRIQKTISVPGDSPSSHSSRYDQISMMNPFLPPWGDWLLTGS